MIPASRLVWCCMFVLSLVAHFFVATVLLSNNRHIGQQAYRAAGNDKNRIALEIRSFQQFTTKALKSIPAPQLTAKDAKIIEPKTTAHTRLDTMKVASTAMPLTQPVPVVIHKHTLVPVRLTPKTINSMQTAVTLKTAIPALLSASRKEIAPPEKIASKVTPAQTQLVTASSIPAQRTADVSAKMDKSQQPDTEFKASIENEPEMPGLNHTVLTTGREDKNDIQQAVSVAGSAEDIAYADEVRKKIIRTGKPAGNRAHPTEIFFTIDASGKLVKAEIRRSSGSRRFDRAALDIVRRASPFLPPPPGAKREFSIRLKSH